MGDAIQQHQERPTSSLVKSAVGRDVCALVRVGYSTIHTTLAGVLWHVGVATHSGRGRYKLYCHV